MIKVVSLPWPPTANTYWRRKGARYFISKFGQEYRMLVGELCFDLKDTFTPSDRIKVHVDAYPPDKRRRDLDNIFKSLLDSLQAASVFHDDNQIDKLSICRMPDLKSMVVVTLEKIG